MWTKLDSVSGLVYVLQDGLGRLVKKVRPFRSYVEQERKWLMIVKPANDKAVVV